MIETWAFAECFELATGRLVWEERLKGPANAAANWSSVVLAGDKCYTITQGGDCFIFKASPTFELVAVNPLGEPSNSSNLNSRRDSCVTATSDLLWPLKDRNPVPARASSK